VPLVCDFLRPRSVVDVGCGSGAWLKVFGENGAEDVLGIDGLHVEPASLRIPAERYLARDLNEPFEIDRVFDLAISLEAAHYIPAEHARVLVASIAPLSDTILFSAAIPHQGGGPGLNRRWPAYWRELFAEHGLVAVDWLRPLIWEDERVDWWYAQNAMLLLTEARAATLFPGERREVLPLVHPGLFAEYAERGPGLPPVESKRGLRRLLFG
jgi:SAM-dependent methyltransferase